MEIQRTGWWWLTLIIPEPRGLAQDSGHELGQPGLHISIQSNHLLGGMNPRSVKPKAIIGRWATPGVSLKLYSNPWFVMSEPVVNDAVAVPEML